LYVPQTSSGWSSAAVLDGVMAMIDRAVADLNADNERLYVIGSSLGGGGVWNLLNRHSGRFAAALAAAGVAPATGFVPARLLGTGVIAVHARDDGVVSVISSRSAVNGILAAAGETQPAYLPLSSQAHWALWNPALATHRSIMDAVPPGANVATVSISQPELDLFYYELPAGGHSVSAGAFYHPLIYEWMFAHGVPEQASSAMAGLAAAGMLSRARKRRTGYGESAAKPR
jgi:poly(3-hydroxybutyrate) depolymerase